MLQPLVPNSTLLEGAFGSVCRHATVMLPIFSLTQTRRVWNWRSASGTCSSATGNNNYLGVTSCPPPTWRYGPRKSML